MSCPNVFIIESLGFKDENSERFEGRFLSQILLLAGKKSQYYYIRTEKELKKVLHIFDRSKYRYLHLSCHGNSTALFTTLDKLPFSRFGELVRRHLQDRRLFVSACSSVNHALARQVFDDTGCYSLIGPGGDIEFRDAAIVWASFYHLMFRDNPLAMKSRGIKPTLQRIVDTFDVSLNYFSASATVKQGYRKRLLKSRRTR